MSTPSRPDRTRPSIAGLDEGPQPPFPLKLDGKVIQGFGRGSSELGIPTANIPLSGLSIGGHEDVESGVYFGWAGLSPSKATQQRPPHIHQGTYAHLSNRLQETLADMAKNDDKSDKGAVYPMCMSIGWNPFYKNTVRSVEVHVMHHFETDFYGNHMNLMILGFIRPELDYVNKEKLIEDIKTDIEVSGRSLARETYAKSRRDPYLLEFEGKGEMAS